MFDGKQHERTSTKSQREADKKAAELKRNLENGEVGVCKKMRVDDFANLWLETYKKPVLTAKSYENVKRQVDSNHSPHWEPAPCECDGHPFAKHPEHPRGQKLFPCQEASRHPKGDFQKGAGIPADCV